MTESVEVLAGGGPADVVELTLALAREMLDAAGLPDADPAAALRDGRAMDSWRAMVRAQGGDPDAPLPVAPEVEIVRAEPGRRAWRPSTRTRIGVAAWRLGAGRARKEDPVSAAAGVVLHRRPGDAVRGRRRAATSCVPRTRRGSRRRCRRRRAVGSRRPRRARRRWSSSGSADARRSRPAWCRSLGAAIVAGAAGSTARCRRADRTIRRDRAAPTHVRCARRAWTSCAGSACRCRRPSSRWSGSRATRSSCARRRRSRRGPRCCTWSWPAASGCRPRRR